MPFLAAKFDICAVSGSAPVIPRLAVSAVSGMCPVQSVRHVPVCTWWQPPRLCGGGALQRSETASHSTMRFSAGPSSTKPQPPHCFRGTLRPSSEPPLPRSPEKQHIPVRIANLEAAQTVVCILQRHAECRPMLGKFGGQPIGVRGIDKRVPSHEGMTLGVWQRRRVFIRFHEELCSVAAHDREKRIPIQAPSISSQNQAYRSRRRWFDRRC